MAMASCILIAQGYTQKETAALIKEKRPVAKPHTGYIKARIIKFEEKLKNKIDGKLF